jgi:hypothetical protein
MDDKEYYNREMIDQYHDSIRNEISGLRAMVEVEFADIRKRYDKADVRMSMNEKFIWAAGGGLLVVTALVIPLLFRLV